MPLGEYENKMVPIRQMTLRKYGIIDLDGLYQVMYQWFYEHKYYFDEPLSRIRPGNAAGREYEYRWEAWRKINEYLKFNIRVNTHIWDAIDMEVIKDGKKVKLTKCRLRMEFNGEIQIDYQNMFKLTPIGRLIFHLYNLWVLQNEKQLAAWWDELYYRVYKLQTIAKEYLDMDARGNAYYHMW